MRTTMPVGEFEWDDGVGLAIAALAAVLFAIALKAYLRTRTTRVLLFTLAFGLFFAQGLLKLLEVFVLGDVAALDAAEVTSDLAILLLFFFGMVKA
jgi:hypothetical protein